MAETVSGPFRHGNRWRIVISRSAGGKTYQEVESFTTEDGARNGIERARRLIGARTVEAAWGEWETAKAAKKAQKPSTVATNRYRIRGLLSDYYTGTLLAVTPRIAQSLYNRRSSKTAGDTHIAELSLAAAFWEWCGSRGRCWVADNPWDDVEVVGGKRTRPKDKLRVDEARRLVRVCIAEGSKEGVAVALTLYLGVRASELTSRVVRDVDDRGRLLWIPDSKTAAGVRQVVIPDAIRPALRRLVTKRAATDLLWGLNERGRPCDRHWLEHHSVRLCLAAGVPAVRPHALRGLHATLATVDGVAVEAVARQLGHAGTAVTRRNYIARGAEDSARSRKVVDALSDR